MKQVLILLLLSLNVFALKVGRTKVDSVSDVASLSAYISSRTDSSKSFFIDQPVIVATNTTVGRNLTLSGTRNNATITVDNGYTLTIKKSDGLFQDSSIRGSGTIIFDSCSIDYFRQRWIGSASLTVVVRSCNGDTIIATKLKAKNGYFDSLYIAMVLKADSINAAKIRVGKISADSIFNNAGTAGYVQYLSNSKKLINAPIYTDGKNVAIGKSSVETWSSSYKALQVGGNCSIMGTNGEYSGQATLYLNNCYLDASATWKPMVSGYASIFRNAGSYFSWQIGSNLTADASFTPTTIMSLSESGILNLPSLTASRAVVTDGNKNIVSSSVTSTELGYLNGVTSAVQTQINSKLTIDKVNSYTETLFRRVRSDGTWDTKLEWSGARLSLTGALAFNSLTAGRALVLDDNKYITTSSVTSTELSLLSGKNSVIDGSGTPGKIARFSGPNRLENATSVIADSGIFNRVETSILKSEIDTSNSIYTNLIYFHQGNATELAVDYLNAGTVNATSIRQNWNDVWDKGALPIYYNNRGTPLDVTDDTCYLGGKTRIKTLTSDSINCTGGIRAERFYLNLSSGYVPYVNSTGNLTASSIYTGGSNNITVGKDTMVSWEVSNRAIQVGGNTAIMGYRNASSSQESYFMNNTFFDGAWRAYTNGTAMTFAMSPTQGWRFYHNSGLTAKTAFSKTLRARIDTAGNAAFKDVTVNNFTFGTETYPGIPIRTIYMRDSIRNFVIGDTTWIYYDVIPNVGKSFIFPANYFLDGKKRWIFKFNVGAVNSRVYINYYSVSDACWISQSMASELNGEIIYKLHRGTLTQIHLDYGPNQEYVYPFPGTSMSDQLQFKIFIITSSGGSGALRSATIEIQEKP